MKTIRLVCALVLSFIIASPVVASEYNNLVSIGLGVNPIGTVPTVEYQHAVSDGYSIAVRYLGVNYNYKDNYSYTEKGAGSGFEARLNYFFDHERIGGTYLSAGVGQLNTKWDWTNGNAGTSGSGTSSGILSSVSVGNIIQLPAHIVIDPYLTVASLAITSSTPQTNLAGVIVGIAGVSLGLAF